VVAVAVGGASSVVVEGAATVNASLVLRILVQRRRDECAHGVCTRRVRVHTLKSAALKPNIWNLAPCYITLFYVK